MGLRNFIKGKSGAYKLPDSQLNKEHIITVLKRGMPFMVTLPIIETVKSGMGHSVSTTQGKIRQTYYTPAESKKVFRTVETNIICEPNRIKILHAKKNGEHAFVKYNDIALVAKLTNGKLLYGVGIELQNGKQYKFYNDKKHITAWKYSGFNPEFPVDVFYNFLLGEWKTVFAENNVKEGVITNKTAEKPKKQKTKKKKTAPKSNKKVDPMKKIKEAKELLDMGAITQEEFNDIKSKYLKDF